MATKAELEAELSKLREQLAEKVEAAADSDIAKAPGAFADMLKSQGVSSEEIAALWERLSGELGNLPRNRPLLTAAGAFAFGFLLGRASKS